MHLYAITRGIKHQSDKFINELQGKYLPFKWRNPTDPEKKLIDMYVQLSVRPIQLWEFVFPEEQRDVILATILNGKQGEDQTQHKKHNKMIWAIRKALGVEKIAPYKADMKLPIDYSGVEVVGIGEKKDYWVTKDDKKVDKKEDGAFEGL